MLAYAAINRPIVNINNSESENVLSIAGTREWGGTSLL